MYLEQKRDATLISFPPLVFPRWIGKETSLSVSACTSYRDKKQMSGIKSETGGENTRLNCFRAESILIENFAKRIDAENPNRRRVKYNKT